ncbi:50S ribosomal protein L20 [Candidatus Parcubacteria bacterium]|nr:MAG: 50S ribosomal protein L20 [Candidatus Parcubacteria bacterium]
MARVKGAVHALKRRRKFLKETKGFRGGLKNKERLAKEALLKKWTYQFVSRKLKKRDFRRLWQLRINAALRTKGLNYSKFMGDLKKANIKIDRKILSELAMNHPEIFNELTNRIKK